MDVGRKKTLRRSSRVPPIYRIGLFSVIATSWVTGIGFFFLSRYVVVDGDFGPDKHPWQQPFLLVHGAAAFTMMICFGSILVSHVPAAWRLRRQRMRRMLGMLLTMLIALQIVSAYLLYYVAADSVRDIIANLHAASGVSIPLVLGSHAIKALHNRKKTKTAAPVR